MHEVAVVAFDGVVGFDLSTPLGVFGRARCLDGRPAYQVRVCADRDEVDAGPFTIRAPWGLDALGSADTVVVPGVADPGGAVPPPVLDALRAAAARGARVASICVGAFTLAAAGLLDGRRATTHWVAAAALARRYPAVTVEPAVLYVDEGCRTDLGRRRRRARPVPAHGSPGPWRRRRGRDGPDFGDAVERVGGQAQFIAHEAPVPHRCSLAPLLDWMAGNADRDLTLDDMAATAAISRCTLLRRFREQTGTTPMQWLTRYRLRRAQQLLESTNTPVEQIGAMTGLASATTFRERIRALVGVSPQAYRRTFRSRTEP
jgi:transcriptional regulator GlxA family with amidase domain